MSVSCFDFLLDAGGIVVFDRFQQLFPGNLAELCEDLPEMCIRDSFRKGHRIRVTVTSSAKNFIFPNSNTREGFASARTVVAHNRVYHLSLIHI